MQKLIVAVLCLGAVIAPAFAISDVGPVEWATVHSCQGYATEESEELDLLVSILGNEGAFVARIDFAGQPTLTIPVQEKQLKPGEFSLVATFLNQVEKLRVNVFLDDAGLTSSLDFKGQEYYITCE